MLAIIRTAIILNRFEPAIFPTNISASFPVAANPLAAKSSRPIPNATSATEITRSLTPISHAIFAVPFTKKPAPYTNPTEERTTINTETNKLKLGLTSLYQILIILFKMKI